MRTQDHSTSPVFTLFQTCGGRGRSSTTNIYYTIEVAQEDGVCVCALVLPLLYPHLYILLYCRIGVVIEAM